MRVLDLSGPFSEPVGRRLADLGADVILVEPIGGSATRRMAPFARGAAGVERSVHFLDANTNKRSIVLDIGAAEGRETFLRLVRTADVVLECFRPGDMDALGLDFEVELEMGILTLEFSDGAKYVINSHRAARQIWMAADRSAWHFDPREDGRWVASKTQEELDATLEAVLQKKLGAPVRLSSR